MASGGVSGKAVATTLAGVVLTVSAVKNRKISVTIRDFIAGKNPAGPPSPTAEDLAQQKHLTQLLTDPLQQSITPGAVSASKNQALGRLLAGPFGWAAGEQWNALVMLWNRESGWRNTADNPSSHAYGIPQALPFTKMPKPAWPSSAGGISSATAQIAWGLTYIKQRYGNPVAAWQHEELWGWY